mgnify:CR=1 FL=1
MSAPPLELLRNSYFVATQVTLDGGTQVVRVTRTGTHFLDAGDIRTQYAFLISRLDRHGRKGRFLLMDLRQAPGRNDPAFESIMSELRPRLVSGYRRVGILTSTAGGTVQVMRHSREDGYEALIASNEADLLSFFRLAASRP